MDSNIISSYFDYDCIRYVHWAGSFAGTYYLDENKELCFIQERTKQTLNKIHELKHIFLHTSIYCKFCKTAFNRLSEIVGDKNDLSDTELVVFVCPKCSYWQSFIRYSEVYYGEFRYGFGVLKKYASINEKIPLDQLKFYVKANPHMMRHISPTNFEKLVGEIIRDCWNPVDVIHVGESSPKNSTV